MRVKWAYSIVKTRGFAFDVSREPIGIDIAPELNDPADRWAFRSWSPTARHRAAVAVAAAGQPLALAVRWVTPPPPV